MDLDELIISMYVTIDDELKIARRRLKVARLRQRGPAPKLTDAEVLTIECVGEFLGLDCDRHLFAYFARHWRHFFPALARTSRTTFARQAANLWRVKELLWRRLAGGVAPADDRLHIARAACRSPSAASPAPASAATSAGPPATARTTPSARPSTASARTRA